MKQYRYLRVLFTFFITMLLCFMAVTTFLVAYQQRNLLYADTYRNARKDLDLMADASLEALLKSDYVTVRTFITRWGMTHQEIHEIRAVAPNGFVIAEYRSPVQKTAKTYSLSKELLIENEPVATIHLVGDYRNPEMIAAQLRNRLFFGALIITALLGVALWFTFRKLALAPLEEMVDKRTRSLSLLNQELEQEIAERISTGKALREEKEHVSLLLNSISEGIYGVDLEGICTFCNPAALRLLGYERTEDIIGRFMHRIIHHTRSDGTPYHDKDCKVYHCYRTGEGCHVDDEVFWRSDRTSFPVEYWTHAVIKDNRPIGAITAFVDITERKRAEQALEQANTEWSAAMDASNDIMYLLDTHCRLTRANQMFYLITRSEPDTAVGRHIVDIVHPLGEIAQCPVCRAQEEKRDSVFIMEADSPGNPVGRPVEIVVKIVRDKWDNPVSIFTSLHDLTHERQMLQDQKKLEEQLLQSQKMESIGTFAGGIAHDFNNILSVIIGYGEMLLADMAEDDPLRLKIEHILEAGDRAAHLTQDLLIFSRKRPLNRKSISLNEIIRRLEKFLIRVIGADIALNTRLHEGELVVFADTNQLEQVMMNLATNARDSMPKGGVLSISTESVMLDEHFAFTYGLKTPGRYALISISDTGQGMNEETRQRIFEPFFTTKEVGKGTGLGLSVVYGIIKQHDGVVNVYSEPGKGTTFRIYLPMLTSSLEEEEIQSEKKSPARGTETILLAEDDDRLRELAKKILKSFGYTVIEAVDGENAVHKYQEHKDSIQLLIFDLIMPKKSGKEAYDEIKKIDPAIKILFITGYSHDIVRDKASIGNAEAITYKPFSPTDLLNKIRSVLDEGKT